MIKKLVEKALSAKRESKQVDFKQEFDCDSRGEWCEVIKDLIAMANSGGGILVFGADNDGRPTGSDVSRIAALDPADIVNKIGPYVGSTDLDLSVEDLEKDGIKLAAFVMGAADPPFVFERPGDYLNANGKSKSAFATGTIYFRHGAKSEPATNEDLRKSVSRQIEALRKEWLDGVRKVVEAPAGSRVVIASGAHPNSAPAANVRLSNEPAALAIRLTRKGDQAAGVFMHEELSDTLFEEINNVIRAHELMLRGQELDKLSEPIYFRIYAERSEVDQPKEIVKQLFSIGVHEYYPSLHWSSLLTDEEIARQLTAAYLLPIGSEGNTLHRVLPLLGSKSIQWVAKRFEQKWTRYSQPPGIYWRIRKLSTKGITDPILEASRLGPQNQFTFADVEPASARVLRADTAKCNQFLSKACTEVVSGHKDYRSIARDLDYLANGQLILDRATEISKLMQEMIGDQLPGQQVDEPR